MGGGGGLPYRIIDHIMPNGVPGQNMAPYIDTGAQSSSTRVAVIDAIAMNVASNSAFFYFGVRRSMDDAEYEVRFLGDRLNFNYGNGMQIEYYSGFRATERHTISLETRGYLSIDGNILSGVDRDFSPSYLPIFVNAFNNGGTATTSRYCTPVIFSFKITDTNGLICDMKPCVLVKNTDQTWDGNVHYAGEYGMWDFVDDIFYGNANTLSGHLDFIGE